MKSKYVFIATALMGMALAACGNNPSASNPQLPAPDTTQTSQPHVNPGAYPNASMEPVCTKPEVLAEPFERPLTHADFRHSFPGKYELDEVHVYHRGDTMDGRYIGSFYGKLNARVESLFKTGLMMKCYDAIDRADVKFISGITVPVATVIYPRSGRVTAFDADHDPYDNPRFNVPMISDIHFDSIGSMSYKHSESKVGEPPYLSNRHLSDVLSMIPARVEIYRRYGVDGFELRFTQVDDRSYGASKAFRATTSVVIMYKHRRH